jgi:DNA invertase Pin-like site-specific DNA recombinase
MAKRRTTPTDPTAPRCVLGYVRVSTEEQAGSGLGLEGQRQRIEEACRARGWDLLDVIEDAGVSAKTLDRPGLRRALRALELGEADGLVVAKLDRLSRSVGDFAGLIDRARREGWAAVVLDTDVDMATPAGEMMANVMASFAQYERRLIGQRTRDALAVKRAQGVRLGRPQTLPLDVVRRIVDEHRAGASLRTIAAGLERDAVPTARGGTRWHASTIRDVLGSQAAANLAKPA